MPTAGSRLLEFAQESGQYLNSKAPIIESIVLRIHELAIRFRRCVKHSCSKKDFQIVVRHILEGAVVLDAFVFPLLLKVARTIQPVKIVIIEISARKFLVLGFCQLSFFLSVSKSGQGFPYAFVIGNRSINFAEIKQVKQWLIDDAMREHLGRQGSRFRKKVSFEPFTSNCASRNRLLRLNGSNGAAFRIILVAFTGVIIDFNAEFHFVSWLWAIHFHRNLGEIDI